MLNTGAVVDQVDKQGRTAAIEGGLGLGDKMLLEIGGGFKPENARYRKSKYVILNYLY